MRLFDALDYYARIRPEARFAECGAQTLSYREAGAASRRIANALRDAGLAPGDRVAFLAKNCLEYPLFYYGAAQAGVVPVPLNYRLAPAEWRYIIDDSGAIALFAQSELARALEPVRTELDKVKRSFAIGPAVDGWEDYADWQAAASDKAPDLYIDDALDVYQMYTSGTTGRPKGAIVGHRAVTSNVVQMQANLGLHGEGTSLIVAPLYHAAACIVAYSAVAVGASLLIQEDFVPADAVAALGGGRVTHALLVPAMIQACLVAVPDVAERDYDVLEAVVYGASPIAPETLRRAMEIFDCRFMQGYGMTETTAVLTNLTGEDHIRAMTDRPELLLSAGRAVMGTELRIVGADDRDLPAGEVGEILGRGPQLMRGYWNLPEATEAALLGGWMHTGDAGYIDDDGYLFIQDRVKDMLVSGGENVYPREVEDVLYAHPAVADVAVIGVPDPKWGEAVKACVVLKDGASATAQELIDFCLERLASYKRPRSIDFLDALPRNPSGKVLKRELREPYWRGQARGVS